MTNGFWDKLTPFCFVSVYTLLLIYKVWAQVFFGPLPRICTFGLLLLKFALNKTCHHPNCSLRKRENCVNNRSAQTYLEKITFVMKQYCQSRELRCLMKTINSIRRVESHLVTRLWLITRNLGPVLQGSSLLFYRHKSRSCLGFCW